MKKSTLLSLLTTAAIVTTTAGTYAVWDNSTATTTSGNISFRKPVTVTVDQNYNLTKTPAALDTVESASSDVSFTITNNDGELAKKLKLTPSISKNSYGISIEDFNISIKHKDGLQESLSDEGGYFLDDSLTTTDYTITVTPKADTAERITKVADKNINVELTATLLK